MIAGLYEYNQHHILGLVHPSMMACTETVFSVMIHGEPTALIMYVEFAKCFYNVMSAFCPLRQSWASLIAPSSGKLP